MYHFINFYNCKTVPQFNDSLMVQINQGTSYRGNRTINVFVFEDTRRDVKKILQSLRKKENNISKKAYISTRLPSHQCDVPLVENLRFFGKKMSYAPAFIRTQLVNFSLFLRKTYFIISFMQ